MVVIKSCNQIYHENSYRHGNSNNYNHNHSHNSWRNVDDDNNIEERK